MSERPSESPSASNGAPLDADQFWSHEKASFCLRYLTPLHQWPLATACILLLDETDLVMVQLLMQHYTPYELATGEYKWNSLPRDLALPSLPPVPDALNRGYSKAVDAIKRTGLQAPKQEDGSYLLDDPSKFLQWAVDEGYVIPDELLKEAKAKFSWDGEGYSANQRLFIQRLVARVILDPVEYQTMKGNRIKVRQLVDDMADPSLWPDGTVLHKNRRFWYELAADVLSFYHEIERGEPRR